MMRVPLRRLPRQRQRGVAIITALLLTTLAVTIVASLFWQQQVQVRSMENQRLHLQTKWILRGALDFARLVLRQDGVDKPQQTVLTGIWTTPIEESRLDSYIEREQQENEKFDATISGYLTDAQARFNLTNLATGRKLNAPQVLAFGRLLTNVGLNPELAKTTALLVAKGQVAAPVEATGSADGSTNATGTAKTDSDADGDGDSSNASATGTTKSTTKSTASGDTAGSTGGDSGNEPMEFLQVEDLMSVSGFTPAMMEKLRDFVVVLPEATAVNINTAAPEVLAAVTDLSVSEASALAISRKQAYFNNGPEFENRLNGHKVLTDVKIDVKSGYFLANSRVRLDRAELEAQSLIRRESSGRMATTVLSIREY